MFKFVSIAIILYVSPVFAADQFDLVCNGKVSANGAVIGPPRNFEIRVDLAQKEFCLDGCTSVQPIAAILADKIELETGDSRAFIVDRVTGNYVQSFYVGLARVESDGVCSAAPFKGFPQTKF